MGSRNAVLSKPRTLDMVPLGEDLQGGSNQGGKALSDTQVPSLRFRQLATQGSNHLVKEGAYGSVEPKPTWSSNMLFHVVKNVQGSPVTLATDCSLSNKRGICVQGHMQSGFELTDSLESAPQGMAINLPTTVKNICPPWADKDAAFIRRLENLPPEQESQVKIPHVDLQQRQRKARHYTGGER